MPRSAPFRLGISAATVRPGMLSACFTTSPASLNCGSSLGGTKEHTSISGTPAAASAVHHAFLASVGMNSGTLCSPSRMPTSRTQTSMFPLIAIPFIARSRTRQCVLRDALSRALLRMRQMVLPSIIYLILRSVQRTRLEGRKVAVQALSPSLEHRLALLVEGADAFAAVFRPDQPIIRLDLEHEAAFQIHLQTVMDRLLGLADRQRRVAADPRRRFHRLRHQLGARAQAVDDAPVERLLRPERKPGEDDLLGAPLADRARQQLRAAGARHDPQRHLGEREARLGYRIGEVAGERHLQPAGEGMAVDRRDHRQRAIEQAPILPLEDLVLRHPVGIAHAVALLEIAAGAEGALAR